MGSSEFGQWVKWLRSAYSIPVQDAEDIVAETALYLLRRYLRLYPEATEEALEYHLATYPASAFRNCLHQRVLNFKRHQARERLGWARLVESFTAHQEDELMTALTKVEIEYLLASFPPYARGIAQKFVEGYSWGEIAQLEELSVGAVKMRFYRGIEWVRTQLELRCDDSCCSGVNYIGIADTVSNTEHFTEEVSNETVLHACEYSSVVDSECVDVSSRPRDNRRNAGGGGSKY
ncbi:MAG: hypothetical protein SNJ72_02405, partial [Fimbriimonadales bacterium]